MTQSIESAEVPARWRDRQRAATEAQIKVTARELLLEGGTDALTLRGIARAMGMTAPGLYRYFPSLDDLVVAVCRDLFAEAAVAVTEAVSTSDDPAEQMLASIRAFRAWAVEHPGQFRLMFTAAGLDDDAASCEFAQVFLGLFAGMVDRLPAPPRPPRPPSAEFEVQLVRFAETYRVDLPPAVLGPFLSAWVRLYGLISLEALGQMSTLVGDVGPLFEQELQDVAESFGLTYTAPDPAGT